MRVFGVIVAVTAVVAAGGSAQAAPKYRTAPQPDLPRTAAGTIIQPTTTILHDNNGHTQVIVVPRRRSYLDTGTEVSVGDRVGLEFRPDRISLFDAASGRAILTALHDHAPAMEFAHG